MDRRGLRGRHQSALPSEVSSAAARSMALVSRSRSLFDPRTLRVVRDKGLHELDRVVSDDVADRGSVRRAVLEQVNEVAVHPHRDVALRDPSGVHQVSLQRLGRDAIVRGELLDPRLVQAVLPLLLERSGDQLDPSCGHVYLPPSWSCSSRSARKLHVLQNSSRYSRPRALSEYTLRGGPFSDGIFSTSTKPRCSILTSRA